MHFTADWQALDLFLCGDQLAQVLDFLKDPLKQARVFLGKVLYKGFVGEQVVADQIRHHLSFDLGGCFLPGIALFPLVQLRQLLKSGLVDSFPLVLPQAFTAFFRLSYSLVPSSTWVIS